MRLARVRGEERRRANETLHAVVNSLIEQRSAVVIGSNGGSGLPAYQQDVEIIEVGDEPNGNRIEHIPILEDISPEEPVRDGEVAIKCDICLEYHAKVSLLFQLNLTNYSHLTHYI